jgi:hypothetical protein
MTVKDSGVLPASGSNIFIWIIATEADKPTNIDDGACDHGQGETNAYLLPAGKKGHVHRALQVALRRECRAAREPQG